MLGTAKRGLDSGPMDGLVRVVELGLLDREHGQRLLQIPRRGLVPHDHGLLEVNARLQQQLVQFDHRPFLSSPHPTIGIAPALS